MKYTYLQILKNAPEGKYKVYTGYEWLEGVYSLGTIKSCMSVNWVIQKVEG